MNSLNLRPPENLFEKAGRFIAGSQIAGDYLEFGVFRGNSLITAYKAFKYAFLKQKANLDALDNDRKNRIKIWNEFRFFGFDSFVGLPAAAGSDLVGAHFNQGEFACSLELARNNILRQGVPEGRFKLVKGWYKDILTPETAFRLQLKSAALIHIDCDLYESTRDALNFVKPLLVDGSVIVFDDWFCFNGNPDLGEQKAFREFCAEMTKWNVVEYQKEGAFKNSFILTRKVL